MVKLPNEFVSLLNSSSLVEKRAMLVSLSDNIRHCEIAERHNTQKLSDYVDYIPSYVTDKTLTDEIDMELKTMKLEATNTRKVKNFWLNSTNHPYKYSGNAHEAHMISNYPGISKLLNMLNDSSHTSANLNSCFIACYSTAKKSLNVHCDDEPEICQLSPICNVSFGSTRTIEFDPNIPYYKGEPVCSYKLESGSLNIMKAGCQQQLKHRVIPAEHQVNKPNVRYCLSFRRFVLPSSEASPVKSNIKMFENIGSNKEGLLKSGISSLYDDNDMIESNPGAVDTVLFAGDSHFQDLDPDKLGKGKINVVNISKGGSRICDTEAAVSKFCSNNSSCNVIKVFLSIGTNDIRYCTRGILHLTKPLKSLSERLKLCFPNAKFYYQSLLPLPIVNPYVRNNVLSFNDLLYDICTKYGIYYFDVFGDFLGPDMHRNSLLFKVKEQNINIHLNNEGLYKLAKKYIYKIHNRRFNPTLF